MRHEGEFTTRGFTKGRKVPKKYKKICTGQIYGLLRVANPKAEWLRGKQCNDFIAAIKAWGKALRKELFEKGVVTIDKRIGKMTVIKTEIKTRKMSYKDTYNLWESDPEAYREGRMVIRKYQEVVLIRFKGRANLRMTVNQGLIRELNRRVREGEQEVIFV